MTTSSRKIASLILVCGFTLSGCNSNNNDAPLVIEPPAAPPPEEEPAPDPQPVDFTTFVGEQFAMTADDSDPQPVDDVDFEFNDQDDPAAFENLLDN